MIRLHLDARRHLPAIALAALVVTLAVALLANRARATLPQPALPAPPMAPILNGKVITLTTPVAATDGTCPDHGGTVLTQDYWNALAVTNGSKVVFGPGCYYVPDELRLDGAHPLADVDFDGTAAGGVHLVQLNSQVCSPCTVAGLLSLANRSFRVSIEGFTIQGSAPELGPDSIDTTDFQLPVNNTRIGLRIGNATDVTVRNVAIRDTWSDAVYLSFDTRILLDGIDASYTGRSFVSMNPAQDIEIRNSSFRRSAFAGIVLEPGSTVSDDRIEIDSNSFSWVGGGWAGQGATPAVARTWNNSWCMSPAGGFCFGKLFVLGPRNVDGAPNITNVTITGNSADVPFRVQVRPQTDGWSLDELAITRNTTTWGATSDVDQSWIALGDAALGLQMTNVTITDNAVTSASVAAPYIIYAELPDASGHGCESIPVRDPNHVGNRYRDATTGMQPWRKRIGNYVPTAFGQSPIWASTECPLDAGPAPGWANHY